MKFTVDDIGIGIPPSHRRAIFEPFEQADGSSTRKRFGGTGLGLSISAKLVAMMDGRIWVDSELNRGSTFGFTATFGRGPENGRTTRRADAGPISGLRVLIVDDNHTNRRILEEILWNWGARPFDVAVDGPSGARSSPSARQRMRASPSP